MRHLKPLKILCVLVINVTLTLNSLEEFSVCFHHVKIGSIPSLILSVILVVALTWDLCPIQRTFGGWNCEKVMVGP